MRNIKFTTKEEYIQYRRDWKEEYLTLSNTIRLHKRLESEYCRLKNKINLSYNWRTNYDLYLSKLFEAWKVNEVLCKYPTNLFASASYYPVLELKEKARLMLEELKQSKIRSEEQYQLAKIRSENNDS